jgi:pSer/pThr/pTyr-binding forkhead associated (FHA) protein
MSDNKENLRAVPADQRTVGPNETMIISPSDVQQRVSSTDASKQAPIIKGTPRLVGRGEPIAGQIFQLKPDKTTVGRSQANDIVINDGTISARHAQIVQEGGKWRVINLISTNGTSVNGRTNIVSYLAPGDVIAFGRVEAVFEAQADGQGRASAGNAGSEKSAGGVSKTSMIVGGIAVLLIVVVAAAAVLL